MQAFIQGNTTRYPELETVLESLGFSKDDTSGYALYSKEHILIHLKNEHVAYETGGNEKGYFYGVREDNSFLATLDENTPSMGLLEIIARTIRPSRFLPLDKESTLVVPKRLQKYSLASDE
jgi:hypothetical protein